MTSQALANVTVNQSTAASIITAHQNLGVLDDNGTFTGDLLVNGNSDLRTLAPLLDHIVVVTGTLTIQSITIIDSLNPPQSSLFTRLTTIGNSLIINSNTGFTSLGNNSFPALQSIGGYLLIQSNTHLASLGKTRPPHSQAPLCNFALPFVCVRCTRFNSLSQLFVMIFVLFPGSAFPVLRNLGGPLSIPNQPLLGRNPQAGAFASLSTIGGVSTELSLLLHGC